VVGGSELERSECDMAMEKRESVCCVQQRD
jgi:hypothetical protein